MPAQFYVDHVKNVRNQAVCNARRATAFFTGESQAFVDWIDAGAVYHDLGKLEDENQAVLRRESRDPLPVAHEDAGVAELNRLGIRESAVLVAGHHAGLFSRQEEMAKQGRPFRRLDVAEHVDKSLEHYVKLHEAAGCPSPAASSAPAALHSCGFTRRLALSCLVDADHGDTARNYGREIETPTIGVQWQKRLEALQHYVDVLPQGETDRERSRNRLRRQVFEACREAPIDPAIRSCDASVGIGKTTAIMAHLLKVAQAKALRHIFVVLPYTNIITQSVEIYRKALVLEGERPEDVVAEHHHQADFEELDLRQLATLWKAPIIVTTAVQFFETLGSCYPARLRKLHELPGSAGFIDEAHAAMPSHLWPQVWRWLETWTKNWRGHLVLASGSLPRFWELPAFVAPAKRPDNVPDLVPQSLRRNLVNHEKHRIIARRRDDALACDQLIAFVSAEPGPRLIILNTVQSAAVVADRMRTAGHDVLHLSTALTPAHRDRIVGRVKQRLKDCGDKNWSLIATSCVEAGIDLSFRTGFRESCSASSLIQIGGRVNRGAEDHGAVVWDFRTRDDSLSDHTGFRISRRVLDQMFDELWIGEDSIRSSSQLVKEALRREVTDGTEHRARDIRDAEDRMEYPTVANLCRVIEADTRIVVVDRRLRQLLETRRPIRFGTLLRGSVQIWARKIVELRLQSLPGRNELYFWCYDYDSEFLGYMAGALKLREFWEKGGAII